MEQPIYNLIIGNISGVKDPFVETTITLPDSDMTKQTEHSKDDQGNMKATVDIARGPLTILKKLWTKDVPVDEVKSIVGEPEIQKLEKSGRKVAEF